jgi:hypothetical protein
MVKSPVSLNLVHVLVYKKKIIFFMRGRMRGWMMGRMFLLLFCIKKIKCFFFTFVFLFIWMQV